MLNFQRLEPPVPGVDAAPALMNAFTSLCDGGVLQLGAGDYSVKSPLDMSGKEIHIEARGAHLCAVGFTGYMLTVGAKVGQRQTAVLHGSIHGLQLEAINPYWWEPGGKVVHGLLARNCLNWQFDHCWLRTFSTGITCHAEGDDNWSHGNWFNQCDITNAQTCFRMSKSGGKTWNNNNYVIGGNWSVRRPPATPYEAMFIRSTGGCHVYRDMCMQCGGMKEGDRIFWYLNNEGGCNVFEPGYLECSTTDQGYRPWIRAGTEDVIDWNRLKRQFPWAEESAP
jgi:hypothetical protein